MKSAILIAALIGIAQQASAQDTLKPIVIVALTTGAADVIQTNRTLAHGGVELNPLVPQDRVGNAIVGASGYLGSVLIARALDRAGHHKIARIICWSAAGAGVESVMHNYGQLMRWK